MSQSAISAAPRTTAYLAVASAYLLIVVGGLVRATGSGLGCPDWPLCHGQPLPPVAPAPLIEFSHRLLAIVTTILAVAASALILRGPTSPRLRMLAVSVPLLLVTLIGLGAVVVLFELPPNVVTLHLALALLLLGSLVSEAVILSPARAEYDPASNGTSQHIARLAILAAGTVYLQAVLGGIVRGSGASLACSGFPLCNGELMPSVLSGAVGIHLLHRVGAFIVVALLGYVFIRLQIAAPSTLAARLSAAALVAALVQGAIGVLAVTAALPPASQVLHVAGAAAVWAMCVALAAHATRTQRESLLQTISGR